MYVVCACLHDCIRGCRAGGRAVQQTPQQLLQEWHLCEQLLSRQLPQPGLLTAVLLLLYNSNAGMGKPHTWSLCAMCMHMLADSV